MALMKRATAKLVQHGIADIEVHRGLYGYFAKHKAYRKQLCTPCRRSASDVVDEVLAGARPMEAA